MAIIKLEYTVPNDKLDDIINAVSDALGYNPLGEDGNPIPDYPTKGLFIKRQVRAFLAQNYRNGKQKIAIEEAKVLVDGEISNVTIE